MPMSKDVLRVMVIKSDLEPNASQNQEAEQKSATQSVNKAHSADTNGSEVRDHVYPVEGESVEAPDHEADDPAQFQLEADGFNIAEQGLVFSVQHILALSGMVFSPGAVRDLPELTSETFDPKSAVSALSHVGFEATYGEMKLKKLRATHCPDDRVSQKW